MTPEQIKAAAERVAERLEGTSNSLLQGLQNCDLDEGLEMDRDFCAIIDDKVFWCEQCGWCCSQDENNDGFCDDCNAEKDDSDD